METPTQLTNYSTHPEADLAKGLLDSHCIQCVVQSDDCGAIAGGQSFARGVWLLVDKKDVDTAKRILGLE